MNIRESESSTLSAINKLVKFELPFAGAALCYVMIERCLKLYLLNNRQSLTPSEIDVCAKVGYKRLRFKDYANKTDAEFINGFLNTLQLGGLEIVYRIQYKIRDDRNNLLHSGFYLADQKCKSASERQKENWGYFDTAASHLSRSSRECFKQPIKFESGIRYLQFES